MRGEGHTDWKGAMRIPTLAAFATDLLRFEVNLSCLLLGFQQRVSAFWHDC